MKATLNEIGDYAMSLTSLHLEHQVGNTTVRIDTEVGNAKREIYDAVWKYIAHKLDENPQYILSEIDKFRLLFNKYQENKTKQLAVGMGNFVIDTIFNAIIRANSQNIDVLNISIEGQTNQAPVKSEYDEYDAFLSVLDEPAPVIPGAVFKPEPLPQTNGDEVKKKSHSEQRELESQWQQSQPKPKQPSVTQSVTKETMSMLGADDDIVNVEVAVVSGTPYVEPTFARAMPHTRTVSRR